MLDDGEITTDSQRIDDDDNIRVLLIYYADDCNSRVKAYSRLVNYVMMNYESGRDEDSNSI